MNRRKRTARRSGFLLILVLVVVMVLGLGAYAFSELMLSHRKAADLAGRQTQCDRIMESGVEAVRMFLAVDKTGQEDNGGSYNNPALFRGILVVDDADPNLRGRFSIVASDVDTDGNLGGVRPGLENESARLNLNSLLMVDKQITGSARQLLMSLPGCTQEIADAILDWIDEDNEPREYGAEADYYSGLTPPYVPKNGPLDTVEELLLVRGVTPQLLLGQDINRNGIVDSFEATGGEMLVETTTETLDTVALLTGQSGTITVEGDLSRGWSPYLTLYSMERNSNAKGQPRVYLNQTDMQKLYDELTAVMPEEIATFIVLYKQNGPAAQQTTQLQFNLGGNGGNGGNLTATARQKGQPAKKVELDLTKAGNTKLVQVLDLVGKQVQVNTAGESFLMESPFSGDPIAMGLTIPILMDNCTVSQSPFIPGRININQAPKVILAGIPGMTEDILAEIISRRNPEPDPENINRKFESWLAVEGIVSLNQLKLLMPFITGGGDVYRAQVVGYYQSGNACSRAEIVWDATNANPRVLFWRDLSHLGRGFALETLGVELEELP